VVLVGDRGRWVRVRFEVEVGIRIWVQVEGVGYRNWRREQMGFA